MSPLRIGCFLLLWIVGACDKTSTFQGECKRDNDCQDFERCDTMTFRCVCASDQACAEGEFCNASGSCQRKTGCVTNLDCPANTFCDTGSGECMAAGRCSRDIQCDLGKVCDVQAGLCKAGCRDTADCDLGRREVCENGQCLPGRCENNQYCEFGRICDTQSRTCVQPAQPFCAPGCDPICSTCTDKSKGPCGDPADLCYDGGASGTFCWVACQDDPDCPSGYECQPTSVSWAPGCSDDSDCLTVANTCGRQSHRCALNQQPCDTDGDCLAFQVRCEMGSCIIGRYCRPVGGCR